MIYQIDLYATDAPKGLPKDKAKQKKKKKRNP